MQCCVDDVSFQWDTSIAQGLQIESLWNDWNQPQLITPTSSRHIIKFMAVASGVCLRNMVKLQISVFEGIIDISSKRQQPKAPVDLRAKRRVNIETAFYGHLCCGSGLLTSILISYLLHTYFLTIN